MLRNFLEKRRVKKIFGKVVDEHVVAAALEGRLERPPRTQSHIEFVIASVSGDTAERISELMGRVLGIATRHGALVDGLSGSVVVAAFGAPPARPPLAGARFRLVEELLRELGGEIKVVHGAGQGCYGLFGSEANGRYSFAVPRFDDALGLLSSTKFGSAQEFKTGASKLI
ncbi:hypothetical protein SBV1_1610011 [Verrucomicrobia bacterium]|nr:hypothetical protein SBV1_1610011 [Verrucomicrobiota bacterium]